MDKCKDCREHRSAGEATSIPFAVHEADMVRLDCANRRLAFLAAFLAGLLIVTNAVWIGGRHRTADAQETRAESVEDDAAEGRAISSGRLPNAARQRRGPSWMR